MSTTHFPLVLPGAEKPSDAFSFLRELQAFLGDVFPLPPGEAVSLRVQLPSLKSLPSLALGPASSETLLVGLLNSSSPTFFSFPPLRSVRRLGRGGELALPPDLLEELRRKLGTLEQQVEVLMGEVAVEQKAVRSLERLKALSALPREVRPAGEAFRGYSSYRSVGQCEVSARFLKKHKKKLLKDVCSHCWYW